MIRSIAGTRTRALLALAMLSCVATAKADVTYNFGTVSSGFGNESVLDSAGVGNGVSLGGITSINLPVAFASRTTFYSIELRPSGPPGQFLTSWSGQWTMSNGNGDGIYGTFQTQGRTTDYTFLFPGFNTPAPIFTRYSGTTNVLGGTGFYQGASGSGSFETYVNFQLNGYHAVNVDRLQVSLPNDFAPPQTDTRGLAVIVQTGSENALTGVGFNDGPIVSGDSVLPALTFEHNDYTLVWPFGPPFIGIFHDTDGLGDTLTGTFNDPTKEAPRSDFGYNTGSSIYTGGTGAYAGLRGGSDYENFSIGLGTADGVNFDYMSVTVARPQLVPVPEPESWVMLVAGLALLGVHKARGGRRPGRLLDAAGAGASMG